MPRSRLKKRVNARIAKTGESHQGALRNVRGEEPRHESGGQSLEQRIEALIPIAAGLDFGQTDKEADARVRVVQLLKTFTAAHLYRTETVMYAGRELGDGAKVGRYYELHEALRRNSPEVTIMTMTEKAPLARYLRRGLTLASGLGMRLEAHLSDISAVEDVEDADADVPAANERRPPAQPTVFSRDAYWREANAKWSHFLREISGGAPQALMTWVEPLQIVEVLRALSLFTENHLFLPGLGGGLDIAGAALSSEVKCIEIYCHPSKTSPEILRPRSLTLNYVAVFPALSYLRLETDVLEPRGTYPTERPPSRAAREDLTEIAPDEYRERRVWEDDDHEPSWRLVTRYLGGAFVIFSKGSPYNRFDEYWDEEDGTYDGCHDKMDPTAFRAYIERLAADLLDRGVPSE
jgi:hypothetical protein